MAKPRFAASFQVPVRRPFRQLTPPRNNEEVWDLLGQQTENFAKRLYGEDDLLHRGFSLYYELFPEDIDLRRRLALRTERMKLAVLGGVLNGSRTLWGSPATISGARGRQGDA
jgi:hypothetical protein